MSAFDDAHIKTILKYNPKRQYIGRMTAYDLHDAYHQLKRSYDWDNPLEYVNVNIGNIDGNAICDALWYEMSYNPVRFGANSPFVFGDRNNIFKFCKNYTPEMDDVNSLLYKIRYNLIDFMSLNADEHNSWRDKVYTQNGIIPIGLTPNGYADAAYKMLADLRASIKLIAQQNIADFSKKRGPYRVEIINTVQSRHPNGVRPLVKPTKPVTPVVPQSPTPQPATPQPVFDEDEEERLDRYRECLEITLSNAGYVSEDMYSQAKRDYEILMKQLRNKDYQK